MKTNGIKTPKEEQNQWRGGEAIRRPSLTKQDDRSLVGISPFSLLAAVSFSPIPNFPPGPASLWSSAMKSIKARCYLLRTMPQGKQEKEKCNG